MFTESLFLGPCALRKMISLLSTVSSTTNLLVLNVVRHAKGVKTFMSTTTTAAIHILVEKITTEVIHPNVRDLPGLLLLVVLAVHSAVDLQTTRAKCRQLGCPRKRLSVNIKVIQSSCLWFR